MKVNKIFAIAIDEYDDEELNKIQNTKSDVVEIISLLTKKYIFEDVEFIFEKNDTTRKSLFQKLNFFFTNALEDENILLIFAGHGEYNEILRTGYWQPSDSDPKDVSTWINIGDILAFINASEAFHVAIISDSCFSGAIFEAPKRGGGIVALENKKSRLALTSGSIEKVSDGAKGHKSPFTENLVKQLAENGLEELPFTTLANNLIISFSQNRIQTPMFGALNNVGHEGGSFIFKLKGDESVQPDNINKYLKERLGNLFIPICDNHIELITQIRPLNKEKHELVKKQMYEEATRIRENEKKLEDAILETTQDYLSRLFLRTNISKEQLNRISEVETEVELFESDYEKKKDQISNFLRILEHEHLQYHQKINSEDRESLMQLAERQAGYYDFLNPIRDFFDEQKHTLIQKYLENVLTLYTQYLQIKANSNNTFLEQKRKTLFSILVKIYDLEIKMSYRWYSDEIDEFIALKKIDVELLNWMRN